MTNEKRGVGLGTKRNTTEPASDRGTVVLVTDRRTLCLVGGESEDTRFAVPHDSVVEADFHSGWFATRFVLRTPRKQYHCWANRTTDDSLLEAAADYVASRMSESPDERETDDGANQLPYRGQPISRENHPGVPDEPPTAEDVDGTDSEEPTADRDEGSGTQLQYRGKPFDRRE